MYDLDFVTKTFRERFEARRGHGSHGHPTNTSPLTCHVWERSLDHDSHVEPPHGEERHPHPESHVPHGNHDVEGHDDEHEGGHDGFGHFVAGRFGHSIWRGSGTATRVFVF